MPLIKTTEELRPFYPARLTFDIDDMAPTLATVEQEYLVEGVLGSDQYQELLNGYDSDSLTPQQTALLAKVRPAIANLAVYHYTGFANVEFGAGGLVVSKSDTKAPAAEWRTRDLEVASLRAGYRGLDVLAGFLEANRTDYPTWDDSPAAAHLREGYLRTTQEMQALINIGNSGMLFRKMLPTLRRIEAGTIADTLCSEAYAADLVSKITAGTLSADETKVVKLVRNATAHLTLAASVVELSLRTDSQGVWTVTAMLAGQTSVGPTTASETRMQHRIDHHQRLGTEFLGKLQQELQRQAEADEDHPYRSSSCYRPATETETPPYTTEGSVGMF